MTHFSRPTVEFVRALYEDSTSSIGDIAALAGIGERTIARYARDGGWRRRGRGNDYRRRRLEREPPDQPMTEQMSSHAGMPAQLDRRRALVMRLYAAAEKHLDAIEERLRNAGDDLGRMEAAVPHFAMFARVVQQIAMIDRATAPEPEHEQFPRSDDELRRELLRKMDALIAARTAAVPREPDPG